MLVWPTMGWHTHVPSHSRYKFRTCHASCTPATWIGRHSSSQHPPCNERIRLNLTRPVHLAGMGNRTGEQPRQPTQPGVCGPSQSLRFPPRLHTLIQTAISHAGGGTVWCWWRQRAKQSRTECPILNNEAWVVFEVRFIVGNKGHA
jgi:hypothetical protein